MDENKHASKKLKLPEHGRDENELFEELELRKAKDADWSSGRSWSLVYYGGSEHDIFLKKAYATYFSENGVSPTAFPSLAKLEAEVVSMVLSLLGADGNEVGVMTSGGTESILLAMKAYRDRAYDMGMGPGQLEILVPESAHPAFLKAAHYFNLGVIPINLKEDFRVDIEDAKRKLTDRTICIVASAPSYPQGVVDPIPELGVIAKQRSVGLHIDACLGGFILPFLNRLNQHAPPFDFKVSGVTSISADLHKNGYAAKGASAILYRTPELRSYQFFVTGEWPGGLYGSTTMTGTRPGGSVAAAWAALMHLGIDGYTDLVRRAMEVTKRLIEGISAIPELFIIGEPDMTVFSFGAEKLNIFSIAERLQTLGWRMDRQQNPDSLHMIATPNHEKSVDAFLGDLQQVVKVERNSPQSSFFTMQQMLYGVTSDIPLEMDPVEYMRKNMGKVYDLP